MKEIHIAGPSVMSLLLDVKVNGRHLAWATGFIVNSRRGPCLVTNRHVVTGRRQDTGEPLSKTGGVPDELLLLHNAEKLGNWVWQAEPLYQDGAPRWVEHPKWGTRADLVVLPLVNSAAARLYPHGLPEQEPNVIIGPSEMVSVIGFPFGVTGGGGMAVWATGFIASEPAVDFDGLPVFLIDCRTRQGQSGSPVLAYRSGGLTLRRNGVSIGTQSEYYLLGVYSGRINDESDIGMVWKASALRELLEAVAGQEETHLDASPTATPLPR